MNIETKEGSKKPQYQNSISAEEEFVLLKEYQNPEISDDRKAEITGRILTAYEPWIIAQANKWHKKNIEIPFRDMRSIVCIGMGKAMKKNDLKKGHRLSTYAEYRVKEAVFEMVYSNKLPFKVVTSGETKFAYFGYFRIKKQIDNDPEFLNATETEKRRYIIDSLYDEWSKTRNRKTTANTYKNIERTCEILSQKHPSLSQKISKSVNGEGSLELHHTLTDEEATTPEEDSITNIIQDVRSSVIPHIRLQFLKNGKKREWFVLKDRFLNKKQKTRVQTAEKLARIERASPVSGERIRQIETGALKLAKKYAIAYLEEMPKDHHKQSSFKRVGSQIRVAKAHLISPPEERQDISKIRHNFMQSSVEDYSTREKTWEIGTAAINAHALKKEERKAAIQSIADSFGISVQTVGRKETLVRLFINSQNRDVANTSAQNAPELELAELTA